MFNTTQSHCGKLMSGLGTYRQFVTQKEAEDYLDAIRPHNDDQIHMWCDNLNKFTSVANCKKATSKPALTPTPPVSEFERDTFFCARVDGHVFWFSSRYPCGLNPDGTKSNGEYVSFASESEARAYVDAIKGIASSTPTPAPTPTPTPNPTPPPKFELVGTGTGFVVDGEYVVTANHVLRRTENVNGPVCRATTILHRYKEYEAEIADLDATNDLGLLKLNEPLKASVQLRNQPALKVGEVAVNYGYPLTGTLSTSAKLNSGNISSLAGYENNSAIFQYDAATQSGNSGGPVMDAAGNVIGVVRSGLDNAETQLVNFAVKSTILEGFLSSNKVPFEKADLTEELKLPDIAEKAEAFTVLVGCWE
jgi:S1-C subfamily serine protease